MDLKTILENIERLLKAKKRSADDISRSAGVPDAIRNLRRTYRGEIKAAPKARTIIAIAAELGVTVDYLMTPRDRPDIRPAPGVREAIMEKLRWLEQQREHALAELAALDEAEENVRTPRRRKTR